MRKTKALQTLNEYFIKKGRILKAQEYVRETDTPIRFQVVKMLFGTWNRMEKQIMAVRDDSIAITDIDDVLAARNKAAAEAEAAWKEASENQDAKALREAQAHVVAEKLALNAATAAGANANKIAIGGPLPHEQPEYERSGATVNIDPDTHERTVIDPEPEIVAPVVDSKTPEGLKAQVIADKDTNTGDVKTGTATDGGSQGSASIATVAASPAVSEDEKKK